MNVLATFNPHGLREFPQGLNKFLQPGLIPMFDIVGGGTHILSYHPVPGDEALM